VLSFRYHAISIVAVLVALLVGLLLGVVIGDKNLVSSAETSLRENLRKDVQDRDNTISDLHKQLATQAKFEQAVLKPLVGGQLTDQRIGLIFLGNNDEDVTNLVTDAITLAQGTLGFDASVRMPMDIPALAARAAGTRYALMPTDPSLIEPFGSRIGSQLVIPGPLIRKERTELFKSASGRLTPASNAIVVVRNHPDNLSKAEEATVDQFETGFMEGLRDTGAPVVGVEQSETDPSQIDWYRSHGASSVSNLDETAGKASLVFALLGNEGAYGNGSDEQILPSVAGGTEPLTTTTP
jgi:hypothetical protein